MYNVNFVVEERPIPSLKFRDGKKASELPTSNDAPVTELACHLIATYDMVLNDYEQRDTAAKLVAKLAMRHSSVLELVIKSAEEYAKGQHISDASPYSPNGFDVLSLMGRSNERVIQFLEETVSDEWGIPRWNAIEVLCKLGDQASVRTLLSVVQGQYPPKLLDVADDLRVIESVRGKEWIAACLVHEVT